MNELHNKIDVFSKNYLIDKGITINCVPKKYREISELETVINTTNYDYSIDGVIYMPTLPLSDVKQKTNNQMLKFKPANKVF